MSLTMRHASPYLVPLRPHEISVPLEGVPQLDDDVLAAMLGNGGAAWEAREGPSTLPQELHERAKARIREATQEIQRRRDAAKLGMDLEQYFGRAG